MIKLTCKNSPIGISLIGEIKISCKISHGKRQLCERELGGSDYIWIKAWTPTPAAFLRLDPAIDITLQIDEQFWHSSIYQSKIIDDGSECNIELECRWEGQHRWRNQRTGIFYGSYLKDVLKNHLHDYYRYTKIHSLCGTQTDRYPWHPSLTQWQESDGAFLDRQCQRHGVWRYHRHSANGIDVVIGDQNAHFEPPIHVNAFLNLLQHSEDPGVFNCLKYSRQSLNNYADIKLWQFNENDPQHPLSHHTQLPAYFTDCQLEMRSPFVQLNKSQLRCVTQTVADSMHIRQQTLSGQFRGVFLQPGQRVKFDSHPENSLSPMPFAETENETHIIEEVLYHYQYSGNGQYKEQHRFIAFPFVTHYRPYFDPFEDQQTQPKYAGHISKVSTYIPKNDDTLSVTPDHFGRVPVTFPYDFAINGSEQCRYIRRCDVVNSDTANSSFPLYKDSECIVTFVNGDLDRPVLLGCVANSHTEHLHAGSKQQQSNIALPQGQYINFGNMIEHNALKMGTYHQEGKQHSFMQLSNIQNKAGGMDDTIWQTTADFECLVGGDYEEKLGGVYELSIRDR